GGYDSTQRTNFATVRSPPLYVAITSSSVRCAARSRAAAFAAAGALAFTLMFDSTSSFAMYVLSATCAEPAPIAWSKSALASAYVVRNSGFRLIHELRIAQAVDVRHSDAKELIAGRQVRQHHHRLAIHRNLPRGPAQQVRQPVQRQLVIAGARRHVHMSSER